MRDVTTERILHETVKDRLVEALDLPPDAVEPWLGDLDVKDPVVAGRVRRLLDAHRNAGTFLESATLESATEESRGAEQGQRIGPFTVDRELGRGGMGTVLLGSRREGGFTQHVAIKVIRGVDAHAAERLLEERRILATLNHASIAHFVDGGTTGDGQPYLAMEYVEGVPITAFCESHKSSQTARIRLFMRVCDAVHFAHQRLVVHRDIKPSNILVTPDGMPKLLDFGIAKLLDPLRGSGTTTIRILTPFYASPEQAAGAPATTSTDVYSLGVLLYELLTGSSPYRTVTPDSAPLAILDAIRHEIPERPGAAAARAGRSIDEDLDAILLKALRKDEADRYGSVEQLAQDLARYVEGQPVRAHDGSRIYVARKFVARHRAAVAAVAVAVISLTAAAVVSTWQAKRADEQSALARVRLQHTRKLVNAMVFELNDALAAGSTSARALLLQRAAEQLDALAAESPDDPVLAEDLATAYHRLGGLQGQAGSANIGNRVTARTNHRKGLAIRKAIAARAPADLEARARLVNSFIAAAEAEDEVAPSFQHANAAVQLAESLAAARPREIRYTKMLASAYYSLGSQYRAIGENGPALEYFQRATPLYQQAFDAAPDADIRRSLALCHKRLGAMLVDQGHPVGALDHLRRAVELDTLSLSESPETRSRRRDLSTSNIQLGFALLNTGDVDGALAAYRRAEELRAALIASDRSDVHAPQDLASVLWYIGVAETRRGNHAVAITALRRAFALGVVTEFSGDDLPARVAAGLATAYEGAGLLRDALDMRRQALREHRAYMAAQPENKRFRLEVARDIAGLGTTTALLGQREPARLPALHQEACAALRGIPPDPQIPPEAASLMEQLRDLRARCQASPAAPSPIS